MHPSTAPCIFDLNHSDLVDFKANLIVMHEYFLNMQSYEWSHWPFDNRRTEKDCKIVLKSTKKFWNEKKKKIVKKDSFLTIEFDENRFQAELFKEKILKKKDIKEKRKRKNEIKQEKSNRNLKL